MTSFTQAREEIERIAPTTDFRRIEDEIIDPAPLNDEQKAALWLCAFIYCSRAEQRQVVSEAVATMGDDAQRCEVCYDL